MSRGKRERLHAFSTGLIRSLDFSGQTMAARPDSSKSGTERDQENLLKDMGRIGADLRKAGRKLASNTD